MIAMKHFTSRMKAIEFMNGKQNRGYEASYSKITVNGKSVYIIVYGNK